MTSADAVAWLLATLGTDLRIAAPLGLGKPNRLLNALYERVAADKTLSLTLFTALSLNPPHAPPGLGARFLTPFAARQWGQDYPVLRYAEDAARNALPDNVRVHEFYFQAGAFLHADKMQRDYVSVNYTHVAETIEQLGVAAVVQLIAERDGRYSLGGNPDLTLDLVDRYAGKRLIVIGVVHPELPFVGGDGEVDRSFFDHVVDADPPHTLFALPRTPIEEADHWIGLHTSRLVRDGGTLQVGIGSLSDAVVAALLLRHRDNALWRRVTGSTDGRFEEGLYGLSEMVTDGFMHLRRAGILTRQVDDGTFLHGAFFLGSKEFYAWLRDMPADEARGVRMTRVSKVNDLYDENELRLRRQRKHARFLNTCMQATLLGGAASETLPDGHVVSGVGGQYNFVAMAHELPDARSILMLRATRTKAGVRSSNIVWSHGQLTIPRHLRDVVVTEYGVAELRGRSDETCIRAMLQICDAEFVDALCETAKRAGKLDRAWQLPDAVRRNTPQHLKAQAHGWRREGMFAPFPFGSDFTPEEERIAVALGALQALSPAQAFLTGVRGLRRNAAPFAAELTRMGLSTPRSLGDRLHAAALLQALHTTR